MEGAHDAIFRRRHVFSIGGFSLFCCVKEMRNKTFPGWAGSGQSKLFCALLGPIGL